MSNDASRVEKNFLTYFGLVYRFLRHLFAVGKVKARNRPKVFVIGFNKTGTTTMKRALGEMGYMVASESEAKPLFHPWLKRDFEPIVRFCRSAEAFQDSPFSFPYTFIALDQAFPGSKFILTVRADDQQWYNSITKFHSKLWGSGDGCPPTREQLQAAVNSYKGRPWDVNRALFGSPEDDPYNEGVLKDFYNRHNLTIIEYFRDRPDDLLIINVAEPGAYQRFANFLGIKSTTREFPWENKT